MCQNPHCALKFIFWQRLIKSALQFWHILAGKCACCKIGNACILQNHKAHTLVEDAETKSKPLPVLSYLVLFLNYSLSLPLY